MCSSPFSAFLLVDRAGTLVGMMVAPKRNIDFVFLNTNGQKINVKPCKVAMETFHTYIEETFHVFSELPSNSLVSRWHNEVGAINVHWPIQTRKITR